MPGSCAYPVFSQAVGQLISHDSPRLVPVAAAVPVVEGSCVRSRIKLFYLVWASYQTCCVFGATDEISVL